MMFYFDTKKSGRIEGFFNNITKDEKNGVAGVYSIYMSENGKHKEYSRTVRIDKNGKKFFTWNKEKIMFDDFVCDTPEEFIKRVAEKDGRLYGQALCHTLLKYGIDCLHVQIKKNPMDVYVVGDVALGFECSNNDGKGEWVEYEFVEEFFHMPMDNYKLKLEPVNKDYIGVYSRWDTYVDDMVALFKQCTDMYKVIVNNKKKEDAA